MKKTLVVLVAVVFGLALTAKVFAADQTASAKPTTAPTAQAAKPATTPVATTAKPATTSTPVATTSKPATTPAANATATTKPTTTPTTTAANTATETMLKGTINNEFTKDKFELKDNSGKIWSFKLDNSVKYQDYKRGDNVEVKYNKDTVTSIAKAK